MLAFLPLGRLGTGLVQSGRFHAERSSRREVRSINASFWFWPIDSTKTCWFFIGKRETPGGTLTPRAGSLLHPTTAPSQKRKITPVRAGGGCKPDPGHLIPTIMLRAQKRRDAGASRLLRLGPRSARENQ
jgi:hypothetical protein